MSVIQSKSIPVKIANVLRIIKNYLHLIYQITFSHISQSQPY